MINCCGSNSSLNESCMPRQLQQQQQQQQQQQSIVCLPPLWQVFGKSKLHSDSRRVVAVLLVVVLDDDYGTQIGKRDSRGRSGPKIRFFTLVLFSEIAELTEAASAMAAAEANTVSRLSGRALLLQFSPSFGTVRSSDPSSYTHTNTLRLQLRS